MNPSAPFSHDILREMEHLNIDPVLTAEILNQQDRVFERTSVSGLPQIDGQQIISRDRNTTIKISKEDIEPLLQLYPPLRNTDLAGHRQSTGCLTLNHSDLSAIGNELFPLYSYGVLNGGSATSYADHKKNSQFHDSLFKLYEDIFNRLSSICRDSPKGITPAFIQADGSFGPSFLELKFRNLLLLARNCTGLYGRELFFQMTSHQTDSQLKTAYGRYRQSPLLRNLLTENNQTILSPFSSIQPLIAAFTPGKNKTVFTNSRIPGQNLLALPGGHGQCFMVLKNIFLELYKAGKRFISLGNVDNSGYTFDPVGLALLALKNKPAAFDFSYKTAVDVKGGILVRQTDGRLNCVDMGVGIAKEDVEKLSADGTPVLFNCANGLFNLEYLLNNIDRIIKDLPLRFSEQDKDAGRYSQAEQVTWEVIELIEDPLIFAVDKYDRFLAAKMLMETLLTSGWKTDHPDFPAEPELKTTVEKLNSGLEAKLASGYGMVKNNGLWTIDDLCR